MLHVVADTTAVSRTRIARRRAKQLGLRLVQSGATVTLYDGAEIVLSDDVTAIETYLGHRYRRQPPGPRETPPPKQWQLWLDVFVAEQKAAKRRATSIRTRTMALTKFAHSYPDSDPLTVTRDVLIAYLGNGEWSPNTAHSVRTSFRVFFKLLYDLEHRRDDPARTLPAVKIPRAVPRPCPDHAVLEAFAVVTDDRVRLALRIAVETGLRIGEIARLRPADVIGGAGSYWLHITGKGGHERTVPIADELAAVILSTPTTHVFPATVGGGPITSGHLCRMVAKALPGGWTAHTLRHRFATKAYEASKDIRALQELLGHVSPTTTAIYTKVSNDSLRAAALAAAVGIQDTPNKPEGQS